MAAEEVAEEMVSDIIKAVGKHSKELGDLGDRLLERWNENAKAREGHRERMATLQVSNMARFLRHGTLIITIFVAISGTLVYMRIVSGDALLFFMGSVIGYLFAYFARSAPAPSLS